MCDEFEWHSKILTNRLLFICLFVINEMTKMKAYFYSSESSTNRSNSALRRQFHVNAYTVSSIFSTYISKQIFRKVWKLFIDKFVYSNIISGRVTIIIENIYWKYIMSCYEAMLMLIIYSGNSVNVCICLTTG